MKNQIVSSVFLMIVLFLNNSCGQENKNIKVIEPAKFEAMLAADPKIVLLDVRTKEECDSGKIANSINIDFYAEDFADKISKLDKDKTYLVYCRSGKRSNKTANMLEEQGFKNIVDLKSGIKAWVADGFPVETSVSK